MHESHRGSARLGMTRRQRRTAPGDPANDTELRSPLSSLFDAAPNPDRARDGAPSLLTLCTGNVCRSPMAALLLRRKLGDLGVVVHSAGTHALIDEAMTPEALRLALATGADEQDAARHRARLLQERMLIEADLTLTMTREQRTLALQLAPSRLHRVFPVREFARLTRAMSDDDLYAAADGGGDNTRARLGSTVIAISHRRGLDAGGPVDDDVVDPYRRADDVYEQSVRELMPALEEVERVVRLALA